MVDCLIMRKKTCRTSPWSCNPRAWMRFFFIFLFSINICSFLVEFHKFLVLINFNFLCGTGWRWLLWNWVPQSRGSKVRIKMMMMMMIAMMEAKMMMMMMMVNMMMMIIITMMAANMMMMTIKMVAKMIMILLFDF